MNLVNAFLLNLYVSLPGFKFLFRYSGIGNSFAEIQLIFNKPIVLNCPTIDQLIMHLILTETATELLI